jgi:hypothetical protein
LTNLRPSFLSIVENHEREWGTENYVGRPTLSQLLHSRIVCMWVERTDSKTRQGAHNRYYLTCYNEFAAVHQAVTELVLARKIAAAPNRKLMRVYVDQVEVEIVSVKVELKAKTP